VGGDGIPRNEPIDPGRIADLGVGALICALVILLAAGLSAAFAGPVAGPGGRPSIPLDGRPGPAAASVDSNRPGPFASSSLFPNGARLAYIKYRRPVLHASSLGDSHRPPPSGDRVTIARSPVRPRWHGIPNIQASPVVRFGPAACLGDRVPDFQTAP